MKFGTWSTEMAHKWGGKRSSYKLVSGPKTFKWRRLITRVDFIARSGDRVMVVVPALGTDPRNPSQCDITNARLAGLVLSKQILWRLSRNRLAIYLQYPNHCQLEVSVKHDETLHAVGIYFANSKADPHEFLPTSLLSYLLMNEK